MMYLFHDIMPNEMLRVPISAVCSVYANMTHRTKRDERNDGAMMSPVSYRKRPSDPCYRR